MGKCIECAVVALSPHRSASLTKDFAQPLPMHGECRPCPGQERTGGLVAGNQQAHRIVADSVKVMPVTLDQVGDEGTSFQRRKISRLSHQTTDKFRSSRAWRYACDAWCGSATSLVA
jgi:hypothetical protein